MRASPRVPRSARKRIVAARVENDDVEGIARRGHRLEHVGGVDGMRLDVVLAGEADADWDDVIVAADLDTVAGEIEQADAALALQRRAERPHRLRHPGLIGIGLENHLEPGLPQRHRDVGGVVDGIGQRLHPIGGIADHQRGARLVRARSGGPRAQKD
jgi:hypothetical protein